MILNWVLYIFTLSPAHNFSILIAGFITILCLVSTCNAILWICWLALSLTVHSDKEPSFHSNILFNHMAYGITFFAYAQHIVIRLLYLWKCFTDAISMNFSGWFSGTNSMMSGLQKKTLKRHLKSSMGVRKR